MYSFSRTLNIYIRSGCDYINTHTRRNFIHLSLRNLAMQRERYEIMLPHQPCLRTIDQTKLSITPPLTYLSIPIYLLANNQCTFHDDQRAIGVHTHTTLIIQHGIWSIYIYIFILTKLCLRLSVILSANERSGY